jgi:hypothetical protein
MTAKTKVPTSKNPSNPAKPTRKKAGSNEGNLKGEPKNKKINRKTVINNIIDECFPLLGKDVKSLTAKDRVNLIKELSKQIVPEEQTISDVPGMNIRRITVKIVHTNQDGTERRD